MKKVFIGLAAVAAIGVGAFCFSGNKTTELMTSNVEALTVFGGMCATDDRHSCTWDFGDGDAYTASRYIYIHHPSLMQECSK